jgi:hypothetical protein
MTKCEQWLLDKVENSGRLPYWKLCAAWAREVGTSGNVVTWPKPIISDALNGLQERGLISVTPPKQRRGSAA